MEGGQEEVDEMFEKENQWPWKGRCEGVLMLLGELWRVNTWKE